MTALLGKVSIVMHFVSVLWLLSAVLLILVILIQKGRGGGLGGVLTGGAGGGLLGSKTGDFLTWITVAMVGLFLLLTIAMAKFYKPVGFSGGASEAAPTTQTSGDEMPASADEAAEAADEVAGDINLVELPANN